MGFDKQNGRWGRETGGTKWREEGDRRRTRSRSGVIMGGIKGGREEEETEFRGERRE